MIICIFIAVRAPIRLLGAKAGYAYTSRECANTFLSITQTFIQINWTVRQLEPREKNTMLLLLLLFN